MSPDQPQIDEHYQRVRPVYETLGHVDGNPTIAAPDFVGWYIKRDNDDLNTIEEGYEKQGRITELAADLDDALSRTDRVLYAITSYKDPDSVGQWEPCHVGDGGTEWETEKPTPEYADTVAMPAWGDIDLADDLKDQRQTLDAETQAKVEEILAAYAEAYAGLYGDEDAVYALDSVGGAYIFGAPEATIPIAEYYSDDPAARERVFNAFCDRSNDWLAEREAEINARMDGAAELIQPDWVNNRNRQYKAPLSLHADHDAVVTPFDPYDPDYTLTSFQDVSAGLVDETEQWAADLTNTEHTDCVDRLVENLWPDHYNGDWQTALDSWIKIQRRKEREERERRRKALERREERREEYGSIEECTITPHFQDILDAITDIERNIEQVAADTIVSSWTDSKSGFTDNSGDGKRAFIPTWGSSSSSTGSGNANYVDKTNGLWYDSGNDTSGGAVKMALIAEEEWPRSETPEGEAWFRGVQHLRDLGYEIPVWTPEAGSTKLGSEEQYDKMPFWAVRRAAVALGVLPPDAFIERENDDGSTYQGFPGQETYKNALKAIEEVGIQHGRRGPDERWAKEQLETDIQRARNLPEGADPDDEFEAKDWSRIYEAAGQLADGDTDLLDDLADLLDRSTEAFERHRALYQHQQQNGDVIAEDNHLKLISGTKRKARPLVNFDIDVSSFLALEAGEFMAEVTITPAEEPDAAFEKQIGPRVFNRPQRFKDEILAERFSTTIEAEELPDEDVLDYIRKYIHRQDAPRLRGTNQMGLKDSQFVTPNGVLTDKGWNEDTDIVHVERDVGAERKFSLSPDNTPEYDREEVAEIMLLFANSRAPEELLPVLGWFYAAPFKPKVVDAAGSFNLCAVDGDSGTGKTGTIGTLWEMFGMCENGAEPFSCSDTTFSMITTLASSRGVPMWMDEYKPSDMADWKSESLHELVRKAATGGTEQRGNADQTTEEYHLRAPVILSGEEGMMGSAEKRRAIKATFTHAPTQEGTDEYRHFKRLVGDAYVEDGEVEFDEDAGKDLRQHALAYYQYVTSVSDGEFAERWREAKIRTEEKLDQWDIRNELDDLEKNGIQTVIFGYEVFHDFAETMNVKTSDLPGEADLERALREVADVGGQGRETHLDRYVQLLSRVALDDRLKRGTHYKIVDEDGPDEELRVNISRAHDKVTKYARDHDITEDLLSQSKDYKNRFKEANDRQESYVVNYSQNTPPISRAVGIDIERAAAELEDFNRSSFVPEMEEGGGDESESKAVDAQTPLDALATGRHSFKVQVAAVSDGEYSREAQGELKGPHGTFIGFVVPGGNENPFDGHQNDSFRIENVKVRTDEDGLLQAVINDAVTVNSLDTTISSLPTGDNDKEAAADGGQTEDWQGDIGPVAASVTRWVSRNGPAEKSKIVSEVTLSNQYSGESVKEAFQRAKERGDIAETPDGQFDT
jgi:hypothetical protein